MPPRQHRWPAAGDGRAGECVAWLVAMRTGRRLEPGSCDGREEDRGGRKGGSGVADGSC